MDLDRVKKYLYNEVKLDYLRGKIDGNPQLPSDTAISNQINIILNGSSNGIIGNIVTFVYKNVSNVADYNNNFLVIKDNIEYLLEEVFDSLNNIIDIINNSTLEKNQILRDLKLINTEFSDIEAGSLHSDGLKYVISDAFADTSKVDTLRTTALLNLNSSSVTLNLARASYLGFPHYRNQKTVNFTFTDGYASLASQVQTPGTIFGDIFSGTNTNRWELVATTSSPVQLTGYFSLKLSSTGDVVSVNTINMKLYSTKDISTTNADLLTFEYMNNDPTNAVWMIVPNGQILVKGPEISLTFPAISTTYLRVSWTKYYPDNVTNLTYNYSITELNVGTSLTEYESDLISDSLELIPYQNEQPTIYSAELEVVKQISPGTSIQFYLATDDIVPGKIIDSSNNVVDITSDDAYAFVPNSLDENGKPENYYTFASLLRDNPNISGAFPYQYWQPNWQQICPLNDSLTGIPYQLYFNISQYNNTTDDLYYTTPVLWGDPNYKGPWPVVGYGGGWATNWSGSGLFPMSGYIWGEDPFSPAGIRWGDMASEFAGYWRPFTPTTSGSSTIPLLHCSTPDFIIPVFDTNGAPVTTYNYFTDRMEPVQKQFWKIFKWPSSSLPIPSTVKIQNTVLTPSNTSNDNTNSWVWNYQSNTGSSDYQIAFELDSSRNFYTINLDQLLPTTSNIQIIQGSFRNVQFTDITPSEITNFIVEYGYEYRLDANGLYQKYPSEASLQDCRATIIFSDTDMAAARAYSSGVLNLSLLLSYNSTTNISASWDGYLLVPSNPNATPGITINNITNVQQISVQQISDAGMILQSNLLVSGSFNSFNLYTGLNLVRIFVDTFATQSNVIDSTIASWRPDEYIFTYLPGTYLTGINDYITYNTPNSITLPGTNFENTNVVPGVTVYCNTPYILSTGVYIPTTIQVSMTVVDVNNSTLTLQSPNNVDYYCSNWVINNFNTATGISYSGGITSGGTSTALTEVDINVLLHETEFSNDTRFALISDVDNSMYAVVKTPNSVTKFPKNYSHFTRTYWDYISNKYITYTTGTHGNANNHPIALDGTILYNKSPNTNAAATYPNISTYGQNINIDDPTSLGFLFWDTAENLSNVFNVTYSVPTNNRPADRIFLMAKLLSNSLSLTPTLNSYSIIINNEVEGA